MITSNELCKHVFSIKQKRRGGHAASSTLCLRCLQHRTTARHIRRTQWHTVAPRPDPTPRDFCRWVIVRVFPDDHRTPTKRLFIIYVIGNQRPDFEAFTQLLGQVVVEEAPFDHAAHVFLRRYQMRDLGVAHQRASGDHTPQVEPPRGFVTRFHQLATDAAPLIVRVYHAFHTIHPFAIGLVIQPAIVHRFPPRLDEWMGGIEIDPHTDGKTNDLPAYQRRELSLREYLYMVAILRCGKYLVLL